MKIKITNLCEVLLSLPSLFSPPSQVYAEGADLKAPLLHGHTALHIAIEQEDLTSLHMIDFILGNSRSGNQADEEDGNTPLHIATLTDNPQCIKLLLNHGASVGISE